MNCRRDAQSFKTTWFSYIMKSTVLGNRNTQSTLFFWTVVKRQNLILIRNLLFKENVRKRLKSVQECEAVLGAERVAQCHGCATVEAS